jgi:hypothetical protein
MNALCYWILIWMMLTGVPITPPSGVGPYCPPPGGRSIGPTQPPPGGYSLAAENGRPATLAVDGERVKNEGFRDIDVLM